MVVCKLVMQRMGFGPKWVRWLKWCVSTSIFSVFVNGVLTGFFPSPLPRCYGNGGVKHFAPKGHGWRFHICPHFDRA